MPHLRHLLQSLVAHPSEQLFKKGIGFFVGIGGGAAVFEFTFGFVPELVFAALGSTGQFPEFMSALTDFLFGRFGHHSHRGWDLLQKRSSQ
jgi:hypothetical protein